MVNLLFLYFQVSYTLCKLEFILVPVIFEQVFTTFDFKDMSNKDKEKGEHDVDKIILNGACVQLVDFSSIIKK